MVVLLSRALKFNHAGIVAPVGSCRCGETTLASSSHPSQEEHPVRAGGRSGVMMWWHGASLKGGTKGGMGPRRGVAHLAGDGGAGAADPWMHLPPGRSRWPLGEGRCGRPGQAGVGDPDGARRRPASAPGRKKGMRGSEAMGQGSSIMAEAWEGSLQGSGERRNMGVAE